MSIDTLETLDTLGWRMQIEAVIDKAFEGKVLERDIPGIGISAVRNGETFLTSYSFGDRENRLVVEPTKSIFRVGTLSHLVTTIAILQLFERGQLDLSADVNQFLGKFRISNYFSTPLTISHLLTHTDGLEERTRSQYARKTVDVRDAADILADGIRGPVIAPGKMITYGTWGMALAGYILEQITETSLVDYAQTHIFSPLEMNSTTFAARLPEDLALRALKTYYEDGGALYPMGHLYATLPATDGLQTTVADMARLMLTILDGGKLGNAQILKETTVEEMLCLRYSPHGLMPGSTYGFMEYREQGKYGLVCDGNGIGVRARMFLLPEHRAGVFIASNGNGGNFPELLTSAFVKHFYPADIPEPHPARHFEFRADRFAGTYQYAHYERRSISRLDTLRRGIIEIKNNRNGTLTAIPRGPDMGYGGFTGPTQLKLLQEPAVFQREDNGSRIAFQEDVNGFVSHMFSGSGYLNAYRKLEPMEKPNVLFGLFGLCMAIFLSGFAIWTLGSLSMPYEPAKSSAWFAGAIGGLLSLVNLIFGGGAIGFIMRRVDGLPAYSFVRKIPGSILLLFNLGLLVTFLTFGVVICAVLAFQYEFWTGPLRLHYLLLTTSAMLFVWLMSRLNLFATSLDLPRKKSESTD